MGNDHKSMISVTCDHVIYIYPDGKPVTHDHSPPLAVMIEREHVSKIFVINPALVHLIASEDFTTFIYHKNLKIL